jgi:hypothetical protein
MELHFARRGEKADWTFGDFLSLLREYGRIAD